MNKVTLKYNNDELFKNVNISLSDKNRKVALVGGNGCGKSSFLKMIMGKIRPTSGKVEVLNEKIGYLPQELKINKQIIVAQYLNGCLKAGWEKYKINRLLERLKLEDNVLLKEFNSLSGGQKVKVAMAGILLKEPSLLLLDEPTNNLDLAGIDWIIKTIKDFNGSVIVVSHDRYLINNVAEAIWEIDRDDLCLNEYKGNYDDYLDNSRRLLAKKQSTYESKEREIKKVEQWLKENEFHPKYRFSKLVMSQKLKLERLYRDETTMPKAQEGVRLSSYNKPRQGLVVKAEIESKNYGGNEILRNVNFAVHNTEKILVAGSNGSGKTTLLNIVCGADTDFVGRVVLGEKIKIGYLKQFSELDVSRSVLDEFMIKTSTNNFQARKILAKYSFKSELVDVKIFSLSSGQLRKLDLAIILANDPDLILLDEPTNHLDIYVKEELENFVLEQELPMIIISHDQYFVNKIKIDTIVKL